MEQEQIYVINEQIRLALIAIISKAVHPNVPFEQVNSLKEHIEGLKPVQIMQGSPQPDVSAERARYAGPDTDGCGEPGEQPLA